MGVGVVGGWGGGLDLKPMIKINYSIGVLKNRDNHFSKSDLK